MQILLAQRPVETQGRAQGLPVRRSGALPQHGLYRVAGHQVDEQEHQGADAEDDQDR